MQRSICRARNFTCRSSPIHAVIFNTMNSHFTHKRACEFKVTQPPVFYRGAISRGAAKTKAKESPLPMRKTIPRRTPTQNFMVSGGANRYCTLLKGDLEVVAVKGNLIIPHRNSATGCRFMSYPGRIIIIIISKCPLYINDVSFKTAGVIHTP